MGNGQDCQSITSSIKYSGPTPKALLPCVLGNGREFPGGQWLGLELSSPGPWVQSLVMELKYSKLHVAVKKKNNNKVNNLKRKINSKNDVTTQTTEQNAS